MADPKSPALHRVENGVVALTFAPEVGGRLMALEAHGAQWLWRNPGFVDAAGRWTRPRSSWPDGRSGFPSWANVGGGKTWPAPQGWSGPHEWAGPPDPVLDAGAYAWEHDTDDGVHVVTMTSPDDERTGLSIERRFVLARGEEGFTQTTTFRNVSERDVEWSIWEVVQVATDPAGAPGGVVEVDVADDHVLDLGVYRGDAVVEHAPGVARLRMQPGVAKWGFPSATGRVSYRDGRGAVTLRADVDDDARYPDGGSRAEIWMQSPQQHPIAALGGLHPDAWLVEIETLSPLHRLAPGARASAMVRWEVVAPG